MCEVKNKKCLEALIRAEANWVLANEYLMAAINRYCNYPCLDTATTIAKAKRLWWLAQVNKNFN